MTIICPACGHNDEISKVSAVYQSGNPSTMLNQLLAPPTLPDRPKSCFFVLCIYILFFGGAGAALLAMGSANNDSDKFSFGAGLAGLVVLAIFWGSAWALIAHRNSEARKNRPMIEAAEKRYQMALERWNRLYYCKRDGLVFDPETNKSAPPERMYDLL